MATAAITNYTATLYQHFGTFSNLTTAEDAAALRLERDDHTGDLGASLEAVANALHADTAAQVETLASGPGYVVYVLGNTGAYDADHATTHNNSNAEHQVTRLVGDLCEITGPCLIIEA